MHRGLRQHPFNEETAGDELVAHGFRGRVRGEPGHRGFGDSAPQ